METLIQALERERVRLAERLVELKPTFGERDLVKAHRFGKCQKYLKETERLVEKYREEERKW